MADSSVHGPASIPSLLGHTVDGELAWGPSDAVVFAAATGAAPATDLDYLDLSRGPSVMPLFPGIRLARAGQHHPRWLSSFGWDEHDTFILSSEFTIHDVAPPAAKVRWHAEIVDVWDKDSSAILVGECSAGLAGETLLTWRNSVMVRGRGGFGGERGPKRQPPPELHTASELDVVLPPVGAALYQLVGEHNPHSLDPGFAADAGLPGPITAGALLIAAAARTITATYADGDHQALRHIRVDHAGPHIIGNPLTMLIQESDTGTLHFEVASDGQQVLLAGHADLN